MELRAASHLILEEAKYTISSWRDELGAILRFEDASIMGFLYEFLTVDSLLAEHARREQAVLIAHAPALRSAGRKAWNIYSVFLTSDSDPIRTHSVRAIDEDLQTSRKIARSGVTTEASLRSALISLLPITSQTHVASDDYETRIRLAIDNIGDGSLSASFFGEMTPAELVQIMLGGS